MAESVCEEIITNCISIAENVLNVECAVCLQTCIHPAELPCGHIFCYLCIKGIVNQGRRCAMCRQDIPADYLEKPKLLKPMDAETISQGFEDGHLWFYEGHNGWWQYDERTSIELECAYQKGERCCDLLIAGFLYVADFDGMLQFRKSDPSRRRRIKRDLATTSKKGIAGLKSTRNLALSSANSLEVSNEITHNLPLSNSSTLNSLSGLRAFSSNSSNSSQNSESVHSLQNPSSCSFSTCRPSNLANFPGIPSPNNSEAGNSTSVNSRNINLDSVVNETLDWTIEQIESLNLELLNDYETLFRDINNYGQLEDNLNQSRRRRVASNNVSSYLRLESTPNEIINSGLSSTNRISDISNISSNVNNSSSETSSVTSQSSNSAYSEISETELERSLLQSGVDNSSPPLRPPRNRGMNRLRARRDSPQHSRSLNCETLFKNFISNK